MPCGQIGELTMNSESLQFISVSASTPAEWLVPLPMHKSSNLSVPCWVGRLLLWSLAELTAIKQQNMPSQEIMLTKQFCWKSMSLPVSMSLFHLFSHMDHGIFHGSFECVSALATLLAPHGALGRAEMVAATPSPSTQQKLSPAQFQPRGQS